MADYIERETTLSEIDKAFKLFSEQGDALRLFSDVRAAIIYATAADVVPVVHGHQLFRNRKSNYEHYEMVQQTENGDPLYKRQCYTLQDNPVAYCSECGKRLCSRFTNYCPNCGAKMDGDV